jgi:hypothetical protein
VDEANLNVTIFTNPDDSTINVGSDVTLGATDETLTIIESGSSNDNPHVQRLDRQRQPVRISRPQRRRHDAAHRRQLFPDPPRSPSQPDRARTS